MTRTQITYGALNREPRERTQGGDFPAHTWRAVYAEPSGDLPEVADYLESQGLHVLHPRIDRYECRVFDPPRISLLPKQVGTT